MKPKTRLKKIDSQTIFFFLLTDDDDTEPDEPDFDTEGSGDGHEEDLEGSGDGKGTDQEETYPHNPYDGHFPDHGHGSINTHTNHHDTNNFGRRPDPGYSSTEEPDNGLNPIGPEKSNVVVLYTNSQSSIHNRIQTNLIIVISSILIMKKFNFFNLNLLILT